MQYHIEKATKHPKPNIIEFFNQLGNGENGFSGTFFFKGEMNLDAQLSRIADMGEGINIDPGLVPMTTFWYLDANDNIVGMSRLRHYLSETLIKKGGHIGYYISPKYRGLGLGRDLLRLTLSEAKIIGIKRALITTGSNNKISQHIIERNNGKLEDERIDETGNFYKRYWINII